MPLKLQRLSPWFAIVFATWLFHWIPYLAGVFLTNSDFAILSLLAHDFLEGHPRIMPPAQHFGGMTLTVVRALWLLVASLFSTLSVNDPRLQFIFTFLLIPSGVSLLGYALARTIFQHRVAFAVGLLFAAGLPGWIVLYGNDFYLASMMIGMGLLLWRIRLKKSPYELKPIHLGLAGFLFGLGAYTWRGALPLALVFFIPLGRSEWASLRRNALSLRYVLWGALIGFMPELVYLLTNSVPDGISGHGDWVTFRELIKNASSLKSAFTEMIATGTAWSSCRNGLPLLVFLPAIFLVIWNSVRNRVWRAPALALVLGLLAYLSVSTYASGASRYLLPMTPILPLGVGLIFERLLNLKNHIFGRAVLAGVCAILVFGLVCFRKSLLEDAKGSHRAELIEEVNKTYSNAGIEVVISDEYWNSNTFTLMSGRAVYYVPPGRPHAPSQAFAKLSEAKRFGLLVSRHPETWPDDTGVLSDGSRIRILKRVEKLALAEKTLLH